MSNRAVRSFVLALGLTLVGCATSFTGDAMFPGGERGCMDKCAASGMTMGAFVYMGDYSTGCVCQPKSAPPPAPPLAAPPPMQPLAPPPSARPPIVAPPPAAPSGSSAVLFPSGAVVAVVTQMRAMEEYQRRAAMAHH
jgi:hypothetical protein